MAITCSCCLMQTLSMCVMFRNWYCCWFFSL